MKTEINKRKGRWKELSKEKNKGIDEYCKVCKSHQLLIEVYLEGTNAQTEKVNIYVQKENLSGEAQNDENLENFFKGRKC